MYAAIESENIRKNYGHICALENITIQVAPGDIFGFLGPNGAGKSTFVKILLDLIPASAGCARLFGRDTREAVSRKAVGFLPENIHAYRFLTVEEFLMFHAALAEIPRTERTREIQLCLERTGIPEQKKTRLGALSKGLLQRTCIAQAVLGYPRLLLLDEPTSGLDPIGIRDLRSLLIEMKKNGTTILLNSHLLSEVERTCDRIMILNKGRILKSGTQSDLSEKGRHLELVVDGFTDTMEREIHALSTKPVEKNGSRLLVYPCSEESSAAIHSIIEKQGGRLMSLAWKGESLEELFYRLVKDENMGDS